ncbi:MAG: glycosyltransferase family 4 protein [Microbacterium sp.]
MQNKHVWLVNHHAEVPSKDGSAGRHVGLGQQLTTHGWSMSIILSSVRNAGGRQMLRGPRLSKATVENGVNTLWVRSNGYRQSSVLRVLSMITFSLVALLPRTTRKLPSPQVVIGSTVHLFAAWVGFRLARRHGVPFAFEIRDVWPETLIDLGRMSSHNPSARAMRALSVYLCRKADLVISPLPGVRDYLNDMGLETTQFLWVSNGVDVDEKADDVIEFVDRDDAEFVLMYLGSHGNANGLDGLLAAFEEAATSEPRLRLRLIGDGTQKKRLQAKARRLTSASRISFEHRVPRAAVGALARQADALVVNIENLPVYRYGISLNKLFDYMLAGRPTLIATNAINNPIEDAEAGLSVAAGNTQALAEAILKVSRSSEQERSQMGVNGRNYVVAQYSYNALATNLASALQGLVSTVRTNEEP